MWYWIFRSCNSCEVVQFFWKVLFSWVQEIWFRREKNKLFRWPCEAMQYYFELLRWHRASRTSGSSCQGVGRKFSSVYKEDLELELVDAFDSTVFSEYWVRAPNSQCFCGLHRIWWSQKIDERVLDEVRSQISKLPLLWADELGLTDRWN